MAPQSRAKSQARQQPPVHAATAAACAITLSDAHSSFTRADIRLELGQRRIEVLDHLRRRRVEAFGAGRPHFSRFLNNGLVAVTIVDAARAQHQRARRRIDDRQIHQSGNIVKIAFENRTADDSKVS